MRRYWKSGEIDTHFLSESVFVDVKKELLLLKQHTEVPRLSSENVRSTRASIVTPVRDTSVLSALCNVIG